MSKTTYISPSLTLQYTFLYFKRTNLYSKENDYKTLQNSIMKNIEFCHTALFYLYFHKSSNHDVIQSLGVKWRHLKSALGFTGFESLLRVKIFPFKRMDRTVQENYKLIKNI